MLFTSAIAISLLLPFTTAIALPQTQSPTEEVCTGSTYEACVTDVICVASWPESCNCLNAARTRCANACPGVELSNVVLDDCSVPPASEEEVVIDAKVQQCFDNCVAVKRCIQSWPEGCYCENGVKTGCAIRCAPEEETISSRVVEKLLDETLVNCH